MAKPVERSYRIALLIWMAWSGVFAHGVARCDEPVKDFSLRDYRGKPHALADYADQKLVVLVVLGTDCPLARQYAPRLETLWREFGPREVAFLGVNSNAQDSITEVAAYARRHEYTFPILKDPDHALVDQLAATRTPEVFVLDADRVVRYRGRVDDQYGVGYIRPEPQREDLRRALDELLAGQPVEVPRTEPTGCLIGRAPRVEPRGEITYANQVSRVVQRRCANCHREGDIAPFPLTSYEDVAGWSEMMREVILEERMPPWNADPRHGTFANDARLTDDEKDLLLTWVENGCPQGDLAQLPPPLPESEGWHIPTPDVVIAMRDEPYRVPAEGEVRYQYFTVDPQFQEDRWIMAAEARPGNRQVVHHILVLVQAPGEDVRGNFDVLVGFAPGTPARIYPAGVARRILAGSRLVFQLHYTPNGSEQLDMSSVGLVFADPADVQREVGGGMAMNRSFVIPAGASDYEVTSNYRFRSNQLLMSLAPHMHLRGKSFRFEAEYPDGSREVLLDVPRYDFNWQLRYELAEPKRMPEGTRLRCTAQFDNSDANLNNPDPTQSVRWGDQTWEEMMIGWFTSIIEPQ